jgi:acyl carrier protein
MDRFEVVRDLMALTFRIPVEAITPDTARANCPTWDSLAHLNLMLGLEDTFGLTLTVEEIAELTSMRAILHHLESALEGAGAT